MRIARLTLVTGLLLSLAACGGSDSPTGAGDLEITRVTLTPQSATMEAGADTVLVAHAYSADGLAVATTFTWSSSDAAVATVTSGGVVHAQAAGSATIRAEAGEVSAQASITVTPSTSGVIYRDHLDFGTPTDGDPAGDYLLEKEQFDLSYNSTRGGPNWVAWDLNKTQFGNEPRCDCFSPDPALPDSIYHVVSDDYTGSGYNRGHMVMSAERTATAADNEATFLMTNILPQEGDLNGGPWLEFEEYTNDLARDENKELYVLAGGTYAADPPTLNGEGKVAIPATTWKIVVVMDYGEGASDVHDPGDLQVIAVNMPNIEGIASDDWTKYRTTVDEIEAATGYDFLALLPDGIEEAVEGRK